MRVEPVAFQLPLPGPDAEVATARALAEGYPEMRLSRFRRHAAVAACIALLSACAPATSTFSSTTLLRPADDLPLRFDPPTGFERVAPADTLSGSGCISPMWDPRDRTELRMVRSSAVQADYAVADQRYGVGQRELLRLECNTGRPLGVVRR